MSVIAWGRSAIVLSLILTGVLAGRAAAEDGTAGPTKPRAIRVERDAPEPAANAALRLRLDGSAPQTVRRAATLDEMVAAYRDALGAEVTTTEAARNAARDAPLLVPPSADLSAEKQLRTALGRLDLHYGIRDGGIVVGTVDEVVGVIDRRVYDIGPICEVFHERAVESFQRDHPGEAVPSDWSLRLGAEDAIALVQNCVRPVEAWCVEPASISADGETLVVHQTSEVHARIEDFLGRLLRWTQATERAPEPWEDRIEAALDRPVTLDIEAASLAAVAALIEEQTELPLFVDPACAARPVTLRLTAVPARLAVGWCARAARVSAAPAAGAVWLAETPPMELRLYDTRTSLSPERGGFYAQSVRDMVEWIEPGFDSGGFVEIVVPDLLLVRHTSAMHRRVEALLASLRDLADAQRTRAADGDDLLVVRTAPQDPSDAALLARLRGPAVAELAGEVVPSEVPDAIRKALGVDVLVQDDMPLIVDRATVRFPPAPGLTTAHQLRLALWPVGVDVGVRDGVLCLGPAGAPVGATDRRIYDVGPILRAFEARELAIARSLDPDVRASAFRGALTSEDLIMFVQNTIRPIDVWTRDGVFMSAYDDLLVVDQTDAYHVETRRMLARLLAFCRGRTTETSAWERALAAALARPVTLRTGEVPLRDVAGRLSEALAVPVVADPGCADRPIVVDLVDAPAKDVLSWCARTAGVHLARRDGAFVFTRSPVLETRFYDVRGPISVDDQVARVAALDPESFGSLGTVEAFGEHALIACNTRDVLDRIDALLVAPPRDGD